MKKQPGKKRSPKKKKAPSKHQQKASRSSASPRLWNCHACLLKYDPERGHECVPVTEEELIAPLDDELREAFEVLRERGSAYGEQKIYNNARAVMFARRVCYMFVRPKKSYLELCFFLPRKLGERAIHRVQAVTKTKFSHTFKLTHADQLEEPLTDWLREAYEFSA